MADNFAIIILLLFLYIMRPYGIKPTALFLYGPRVILYDNSDNKEKKNNTLHTQRRIKQICRPPTTYAYFFVGP